MDYLEFHISCKEDFREILMAELSEIGFDSFLETEEGIDAYVESSLFNRDQWDEIVERYTNFADLKVEEGELEKKNWNAEWESNYDPIAVDDLVFIRASFHAPQPGFKHEIVINPKMSFGTGHHETTYLMIKHQCELAQEHQGKRILDVGSGTGILAIMAHLLGAKEVEAFDIDEWCVENGNENFALNNVPATMEKGTIREIKPQGEFDIILANINKNILLDEMEEYASLMKNQGYLLLSGFYESDIPDLEKKLNSLDIQIQKISARNNWASLICQKS